MKGEIVPRHKPLKARRTRIFLAIIILYQPCLVQAYRQFRGNVSDRLLSIVVVLPVTTWTSPSIWTAAILCYVFLWNSKYIPGFLRAVSAQLEPTSLIPSVF